LLALFLVFLGASGLAITVAKDVSDAATKAVASVSTADEIAKLQQLKDAGAITPDEFETLKKKALAT